MSRIGFCRELTDRNILNPLCVITHILPIHHQMKTVRRSGCGQRPEPVLEMEYVHSGIGDEEYAIFSKHEGEPFI